MNVKITGHTPQQPAAKKPEQKDTPTQIGRQPSGNAPTAKDTINLSISSSVLQQANTAIKNTPTLDIQRVASLNKAISTGTYQVNNEQVAEKLIQFERNLG